MFAQIIRGKVSDPAAVRAGMDRWVSDLAPTAVGWLGSTTGVSEDGDLFVLARFDSEASAKANSEKPEHDRWFADMTKLFDGEPTFQDSTNVTLDNDRDTDTAGLMHVMRTQVTTRQ